MVKDLKDANVQRINLSSSITKELVMDAKLDDILFHASVEFWKRKLGLVPVTVDGISTPEGAQDGVKTGRFVMQGGTIWSRALTKYRKIVTVYLCGHGNYTYANVTINLPGVFKMSPEEIEEAIDTINSFREHLVSSARENYVEGAIVK